LEEIPGPDDVDWGFAASHLVIPGSLTKNGFGILYTFLAMQDPSTLDIEKVIRWNAWYYTEGMFSCGMETLRNGVIMITDFSGFGWRHLSYKFQRRMLEIWQDNFPTKLKKAIQINCPSYIKMVWSMVKPWFNKKFVERYVVGTVEDLKDSVDKDQLWEFYGGRLTAKHEEWVESIKDYGRWFKTTYPYKKEKGARKVRFGEVEQMPVDGVNFDEKKVSFMEKTDEDEWRKAELLFEKKKIQFMEKTGELDSKKVEVKEERTEEEKIDESDVKEEKEKAKEDKEDKSVGGEKKEVVEEKKVEVGKKVGRHTLIL